MDRIVSHRIVQLEGKERESFASSKFFACNSPKKGSFRQIEVEKG